VSFGQAWASGRNLSLEQAIELALTEAATVGQEIQAPRAAEELKAQPDLIIVALGPGRVWRGGRELVSTDWRYAKAKELLFFLLCQPPQTKEQIGLALWPEASPDQLRNNLGVTLHYLRRALGRTEWIIFEQEHYSFNHALSYVFDLESFESSLATARRLLSDQAVSHLADAVNLYQGDFCADLADGDWPGSRREELRRLYLDALLRLGGLQFADGRFAEAAETFQTAIAADSYLEQAHRELMRCYARQGERGQALRHYQALHKLLVEQVGAPPAPETAALHERLKRGEDV
jgi:DNA-binding SARP family transcriptional activator